VTAVGVAEGGVERDGDGSGANVGDFHGRNGGLGGESFPPIKNNMRSAGMNGVFQAVCERAELGYCRDGFDKFARSTSLHFWLNSTTRANGRRKKIDVSG
jgi:hypothetical protein